MYKGENMYLHTGKNCIINTNEIIGIFNINLLNNNNFILDNLIEYSEENKSFILLEKKGISSEIFSNISPNTLANRSENI